jgi:hypothetical protein
MGEPRGFTAAGGEGWGREGPAVEWKMRRVETGEEGAPRPREWRSPGVGGWGFWSVMTWMAERPENGTENKVLYD